MFSAEHRSEEGYADVAVQSVQYGPGARRHFDPLVRCEVEGVRRSVLHCNFSVEEMSVQMEACLIGYLGKHYKRTGVLDFLHCNL
jgi:hypothetical protein